MSGYFMNTVTVLLDIPSDLVPQATYVFHFFGNAWGLHIDVCCNKDGRAPFHIYYGNRDRAPSSNKAVIIECEALFYDSKSVRSYVEQDGLAECGKDGSPVIGFDVVASVFRLLTMADEQQIISTSRDRLGNFFVDALPEYRRGSIDLPLVDYYAAFLLDKLLCLAPEFRTSVMPRWPNGKKFAVCLSHDCDLTCMGAPLELATAVVKGFVRRKRVFFDMALEGVKCFGSPMDSTLWGFSGWHEFEKDHKMKSCFYLSLSPRKSWRRLNDCKSDVFARGVDWKVFQSMHKEGWEFGLHPSLDAQMDLEEIILQKKAIEERLEAPIMGLRHHYLAIDNFNPHLTFQKHVEAGFVYDSSLGWEEKAGFRSGTSLPFYPYDPLNKAPFTLTELPLSLMDTYVMHDGDTDSAIKEGRRISSLVRDIGGMIMLNWHTESYCSNYIFSNYLLVLRNILEPLLEHNDIWVATPVEIAEWWNNRNRELQHQLLG